MARTFNGKLKLTAKCLTIGVSALVLGFSQPALSLVVSDPGVYARMATELKELKKHFEVLKQQLEKAKEIQEAVTGNLKRGAPIIEDLKELQDIAEGLTKGAVNLPNVDLEDYDLKNIEDLKDVIEKVYEREGDIFDQGQNSQQRKDYQQRTVKGALESSEIIIAKTDDRLEKIGSLVNAIDSTESLKDAVDLNNRLLGEILMVQQQLLLLQSQYVRANTAMNYRGTSGADDNAPNKRKNRVRSILKGAGDKYKSGQEKIEGDQGWEKPPYMYQ